jgi:DUF4097 and DUF4098 domain-containing protein YvlB
MKRWLLFLFLVGLGASLQASTVDRIERRFDAPTGETLHLDLRTGGSVVITGWDRKEVHVIADARGRDAEDCKIDIEKVSDGVEIRSVYKGDRGNYSTSFRFEISVPEHYDIELSSGGGSINIVRLNGNFSGQTGGGEIRIKNSKGTADLSTGGGEILLEDSDLEGNVSTGGGDVVLMRVTGGVQASTGGGKVRYEDNGSAERPAVNVKSPRQVVEISTGGGPIHLDGAPFGAKLSTGGGDIRIRSAQKFVEATTGGGDITVESMNGSLEASTGGGDISAEMTGDSEAADHDVSMSSGKGDMTLSLPASFSGDVFIKIGYTRGNEDAKIVSDFDVKVEKTDEWSSREGTPRKYIYGKVRLGSGKNSVRIETVNGNVYLKKVK